MPIDNLSHSLASPLPPPSPHDEDPVASWPTAATLEQHLLDLSVLPVGSNGSRSAAREAERHYDLASPIKRLLDESEPYPQDFSLADRLQMIVAAVHSERLPAEHARRLFVPIEPSWLNELNTSRRIDLAHVLFKALRSGCADEPATNAERTLFLRLLEVHGDSPSQVLLNMGLFNNVSWLPPIDRQKALLASRLVDFMIQMRFTDADIQQISDVPRKPAPPFLLTLRQT